MIAAYEEKQRDLRKLNKGKSHKSSRGAKKRKIREESQASEHEVCNCMHVQVVLQTPKLCCHC